MTDLDVLNAASSPPRDEATCARLAWRIDSIGGFIAYGALWFFGALMIATFVLLGGIAVAGEHAGKAAAWSVLVAWALSFVLAWVPFVLWVRGRRRRSRAVIRDGVMLAGVIEEVHRMTVRRAPFTRASVRFDLQGARRSAGFSVGGHPQEIAVGLAVPVLVTKGGAHCLLFPPPGRGVAGAVRG